MSEESSRPQAETPADAPPPPPPPGADSGHSSSPDPDIVRFLTIAFGALLIAAGLSFLGGLSIWRTLEFLSPVRRYWGDIRQILVGGALLIGGMTLIVYRDRLKFSLPSGERRIYRSRDQKMVSGVLGGLGDYLGTDPTLLRLIYVALAILFEFWLFFVAYVIASIVIPQEPEVARERPTVPGG